MRIKHWQGYGTVNARKTAFSMNADGTNTVQVTVTGLHEYGLVRRDEYDVFNWLAKRFAKDCPDYRAIRRLEIDEPDDETAVYKITYRPARAV